jgi:hypothetical protein
VVLPGAHDGHVTSEAGVAAVLDERRRRVELELTTAAGGDSLCSISRSAGSVPAVKYLEGRMAALREIGRARRAGDDVTVSATTGRDRWTRQLDGARHREMGPDWIAYYAGGADELEELVATLAPPGS